LSLFIKQISNILQPFSIDKSLKKKQTNVNGIALYVRFNGALALMFSNKKRLKRKFFNLFLG